MNAKVYSYKTLIGTTVLQAGDENMGCLYGEFIPNENYFQFVQMSVWDFWNEKPTAYERWQALMFNVQLENGYFLNARGGFTFGDFKELPNEPIQIDIAGVDRIVFDEYLANDQNTAFVMEPWSALSIDQKIDFEEELYKEIGAARHGFSLPIAFNGKVKKHPLSDYRFFALCTNKRYNDDVLFFSQNNASEYQFALIHITWKGEQEMDTLPSATFYTDWNSFKQQKM